eukprot:TRINITY_DN12752_c0_g2_i2.p1 TRINITY_DN12752_c0_g2~~TRINITY_DN12752_c0_g2_i2.p1  ORF type:complete len:504 (+),score=73.13 TRINITY_DN12752_c0_g2_i2:74-1513(+)
MSFVGLMATGIMYFVVGSVCICLLCVCMRRYFASSDGDSRVFVIVFGDIGRSPRMMNHAMSFAKKGVKVSLIGYTAGGTGLPDAIKSNPFISVSALEPFRSRWSGLPYIGYVILKISYDVFGLLRALQLENRDSVKWVLIQNPPMVPMALFCWAFFCGTPTKIAIDFHNFGYSILGVKLEGTNYTHNQERHVLVRILKYSEKFIAQLVCDRGFCVTAAMKAVLHSEWGINSERLSVLHDKAKAAEKIESPSVYLDDLLSRGYLEELRPWLTNTGSSEKVWRDAKKLISCTSWTPDEDFQPLFQALPEIAQQMRETQKLIVFITGKGDLRDSFEKQYAALKDNVAGFSDRVRICFLWLPFADYPKLLQAADFGLSMHQSSSGLDLPMKVVDMFGFGGLPVLARDFAAMGELVEPGRNGYLWKSEEELRRLLTEVVLEEKCDYKAMRKAVQEGFAAETWEDVWEKSLWSRFQADVVEKRKQ